MNAVRSTLQRGLRIGLAWASLWLVFWTIVGAIIAVVDPDSIDPGEGPMAAAILGSMGLFSGVAFGILLSIGGGAGTTANQSFVRVAGCGMIGSAIVQLAYLNHGDLGLAANIRMALLFCAISTIVTMVWLVMARRWSLFRNTRQA